MSQLGNGPGPTQTNLVQVGTNNDWAAVCGSWMGTLGLRKDGSLWTWGPYYVFGAIQSATMNSFSTPTRVCRETNWAGFAGGFATSLVRSRSDELWQPFYGVPNADAAAASTLRLLFSNSPPGRVAVAFCGTPQLFEARSDGTLWQRDFPFFPATSPTAGKWRQVGKRGGWVSLWSGGGTAFGMTGDGTLWTWGIDPTQDPTVDFLSRLKLAQQRVMSFFSSTPTPVARTMGPTRPAYQKQPRPLMHLVSTNSTP